jgi:hypothetical protein
VVAKPPGTRDAELGERADHLAERGILAADLAEIGHAQVVEPKDEVAQGMLRENDREARDGAARAANFRASRARGQANPSGTAGACS